MTKSRNNIRKRRISKRISKRRSIYGGQSVDEVKACPNASEPRQKWKYGDNCYVGCDGTKDKTFEVSYDDDHDQRTCEADTPQNRRRYNYLRALPSAAFKAARVTGNAAIAVKDGAIAAKDKAVYAYNVAAPYAVAAKDKAAAAFNYMFPESTDDDEDEDEDYPW